jgi:LPXTG-motif cell wall-anchored protein
MVKRLLVLGGLTVGLLLTTGPAGAQQYPPGAFFLTLSDTTVVPGQTITATAAVTPGATSVTFTLFSVAQTLATATPDAGGNVSASLTIPTDAAPGDHTITATDSTGLELSASVTVVGAEGAGAGAPGGPAAAGALPRTGDDSRPLLPVGAVLVALGGVLVVLARRRLKATAKV